MAHIDLLLEQARLAHASANAAGARDHAAQALKLLAGLQAMRAPEYAEARELAQAR
jgi:hypothetical protein